MTLIAKKIDTDNIFNCSDLSKFVATIVQILPIKSASGSRFYLCEYDGLRFLTKVGFYRKNSVELYSSSKAAHPTDAEIEILQKLHETITEKRVSPCILELVYVKICHKIKVTDCDQYLNHEATAETDLYKELCAYKGLIDNDLAHGKIAFIILDRCEITFTDYLRRETTSPVFLAVFRSLLFQVVYTIYALNVVYPRFRHHDLHTANVMLKIDTNYKFRADNVKYLEFNVKGRRHLIPYFGLIAKIIDFGYSELPEENVVSMATDDKLQNYYRVENDLVFFYHWIHLLTQGSVKIDKILTKLDPSRSFTHYDTEYIRKETENKIPTYQEMIDCSVWNDYRKMSRVEKNQIYAEYSI